MSRLEASAQLWRHCSLDLLHVCRWEVGSHCDSWSFDVGPICSCLETFSPFSFYPGALKPHANVSWCRLMGSLQWVSHVEIQVLWFSIHIGFFFLILPFLCLSWLVIGPTVLILWFSHNSSSATHSFVLLFYFLGDSLNINFQPSNDFFHFCYNIFNF